MPQRTQAWDQADANAAVMTCCLGVIMQALLQIATAVYLPIMAATLTGFLLSRFLTRRTPQNIGKPLQKKLPDLLARALYLVGIPIGVANFIRKADLNASVWLSPVIAWAGVILAIVLSGLILRSSKQKKSPRTKGSFVLLSYLGNTSYLGFPVILLLPQLGAQFFSSAVLYDILGTLLAGYGLGVFIAKNATLKADQNLKISSESLSEGIEASAKEAGEASTNATASAAESGSSTSSSGRWRTLYDSLLEITKNPVFYAFFIGLYLKTIAISDGVAAVLNAIAWGSIMIALVVMGMRAEQLKSGGNLRLSFQPVVIKTILVPLIMGAGLTVFGFDGPQRLVLVLQASMPCAFASLVLAENYDLDLNLTVSSILLSCLVFAFAMPIWVLMFTTW